MDKTEHPSQKMLIELRSVEVPRDGWQRCYQCPVCGWAKVGKVGTTLTIKGVWYCNGVSLSTKKQEWVP